MSTVTHANSILGNINNDETIRARYEDMLKEGLCEIVRINRIESERVRMRKITDKGSDVIITLPQGSRLRHGDVIYLSDKKMIVIELEKEDVVMIKIKDDIPIDHAVEVAVRVGHTVGNLHRPIKVKEMCIYSPIQADTEIEMLKRLLATMLDHLIIDKTRMIFEPDEGANIHEH